MARKNSYDYFDFFSAMAQFGNESACLLETIFTSYDYEKLTVYKEDFHKIEHSADLKKHEMMKYLMKEFLPPIDREDILEISDVLDEVCDTLEEVILLMYMNDIKTIRQDSIEMVVLIKAICDELCELVSKFNCFKKADVLLPHIIKINAMEEDGDRWYIEAMRRLKTDGTDVHDVIAWREIYNYLEACCDACEAVADAIEKVVMRNS